MSDKGKNARSATGIFQPDMTYSLVTQEAIFENWQVRRVDQTRYPMIVVASLSAVPQSCRTPLLVMFKTLEKEHGEGEKRRSKRPLWKRG